VLGNYCGFGKVFAIPPCSGVAQLLQPSMKAMQRVIEVTLGSCPEAVALVPIDRGWAVDHEEANFNAGF
jgi:hypothetical protein